MSLIFLQKLCMAMLLGAAIGIDRQLKHKPLGLKTSMVISVASCLITIVSIESVHRYAVPGLTTMDPMRLAAQIISGVGFIGAGVILRRSNEIISGLTTAAMVWAASALGIAAGAGFYKEASTAVFLIIMAINIVPLFFKWFGPKKLSERNLSILIIVASDSDLSYVIDEMQQEFIKVKHIKIKDLKDEMKQIQLVVAAPERHRTTVVYSKIKKIKDVIAVEVETIST
ncbi:MgtC/SapB family protein [Paenibacillus lutrae]|uniref:MgtC/SapB family protein n=1 Tax=Paenibacillus lutrae TaxID=2078573 RepID=A0A7X3K116_9BACL|nr:MgtC/SapB family protein [Paenibacillus lutrae]MVP01645.1 MgtC/SapB family protein [Paenibacillus lutrae]